MSVWDAFLYGLIQGLTEFLPVSSSGHLAVLPLFLHIPDPGVAFDLFMHLGTASAVSWYFRRDLWATFCALSELKPQNKKALSSNAHLGRNLLMATVASFILILILKPWSERYGRSPHLVAFNLIFFGVAMALADRRKALFDRHDFFRSAQAMKSGIWMGLAQAIAIFPGVSRSGATLTMARFLGLSRSVAGEFSFMLTLPVIYAGAAVHLLEYLRGENGHAMVGVWPALVGLFTSFAVGLATVHFFLKALGKIGLWPFALYRIALALVLIASF